MQNYFNYFTEIEERFQQRRGSLLMLSTLDWALIETWSEAGVPLAAVLRGIDAAFDKHDAVVARAGRRVRKVNGLAWCSQAVMEAVEQAKEAAVGAAIGSGTPDRERESGFERERVVSYLNVNAAKLEASSLPAPAEVNARETASRLREMARGLTGSQNLEELDRTLTVLEEKVFAALMTVSSEEQLVALREQAARDLAPYKGKMQAVQIRQVQQQFLQKKLLEQFRLPRLSLFYMGHDA